MDLVVVVYQIYGTHKEVPLEKGYRSDSDVKFLYI